MNIIKKFNLRANGHKDIDFIDIDEILDTSLYIDPYVIRAIKSDFCTSASKTIDSFFYCIFEACKNKDKDRLMQILEHTSEPNETNLGMKKTSDYGKASTAKELTEIFLDFYKEVLKNPNLDHDPLALCMYIKNFAEDKMSDLITNIIRRHLYLFTIEQCKKWGIPQNPEAIFVGYYWDQETENWNELYGNPIVIGGNKILLTPKKIVRKNYYFNVERFIRQYILKVIQKNHLDKNTDMCTKRQYTDGSEKVIPPNIDDLYKAEVQGNIHKDYALNSEINDKNFEDQFIRDINRKINDGEGSLTDSQLDDWVYKKYINAA